MGDKIAGKLFGALCTGLCVWFVWLFYIQSTDHSVCINNGYTESTITVRGDTVCIKKEEVFAKDLPGYKE